MTIRINSNGSKWAGQAPDTIEELLAVLVKYPLDRRFEVYGNFVQRNQDGSVSLFGNFLTISHVFSIEATSAAEVQTLIEAIGVNQQRADYLRQPVPQEPAKGHWGTR